MIIIPLSGQHHKPFQTVSAVILYCLLLSCGETVSPTTTSDLRWHTGFAIFRGHEDLTRFATFDANQNLPPPYQYQVPPSGDHGARSENSLVRGNFETDFPSETLLQFYQINQQDPWHTNGNLQILHGMRNFQDNNIDSNQETCHHIRSAIESSVSMAFSQFDQQHNDSGMYWIGHSLHILQDTFSTAHVLRYGDNLQYIKDFCSYVVKYPNICFHDALDLRDRVWRTNQVGCSLNSANRSWECLTSEAQQAVHASTDFLLLLGEKRVQAKSRSDGLNKFFARWLDCHALRG